MNNERLIVAKFGGSSMANSDSIKLVMEIMNNPARRVIVVSAPGKDEHHSAKVTDLLLQKRFAEVQDRFHEIGRGLGWKERDQRIAGVMTDLQNKPFIDFRASRGEYLTAQMLADVSGAQFVDARELIRVSGDRRINNNSYELIENRLGETTQQVIVPGFYGENWRGWIRTIERDGSDNTGAAISRALRAEVYEIFSDTAVRTADPRIDPNAEVITSMEYEDLARLAASGSRIVHPQVVDILRGTGVSINCRNTFAAEKLGTWIQG